jgi:hypothetical protein
MLNTKKAGETKMMKMFGVVRDFLDRYYKATRSDRFYRPKFADSVQSLWLGLTEREREITLALSRKDDLASFEKLLISIDENDQADEND